MTQYRVENQILFVIMQIWTISKSRCIMLCKVETLLIEKQSNKNYKMQFIVVQNSCKNDIL